MSRAYLNTGSPFTLMKHVKWRQILPIDMNHEMWVEHMAVKVTGLSNNIPSIHIQHMLRFGSHDLACFSITCFLVSRSVPPLPPLVNFPTVVKSYNGKKSPQKKATLRQKVKSNYFELTDNDVERLFSDILNAKHQQTCANWAVTSQMLRFSHHTVTGVLFKVRLHVGKKSKCTKKLCLEKYP